MDTLDPGEAGDTAEAGGGHGPGSVYGRRNPWGNQSYADLITQVSVASGYLMSIQIHKKYFSH